MSALGQKQTLRQVGGMSALPPEADMCVANTDVRFVPIADIHLAARSSNKLRELRIARLKSWIEVKNPKAPAATRAIDGNSDFL